MDIDGFRLANKDIFCGIAKAELGSITRRITVEDIRQAVAGIEPRRPDTLILHPAVCKQLARLTVRWIKTGCPSDPMPEPFHSEALAWWAKKERRRQRMARKKRRGWA